MEVKFGIIAVLRFQKLEEITENEIIHFCGYEKEPTIHDWIGLYTELQTDPEFLMAGMDFVLLPATSEIIEFYSQNVIPNAEIEEEKYPRHRIYLKRGMGSTIDMIDGLKEANQDGDIESWIEVEKRGGGAYMIVNDNLREKNGRPIYDATELGFSGWDHLVDNLDTRSDEFQCFGISSHLHCNGVDLQPNRFRADSIQHLEQALQHVTICAWCPGDI